MFTDVNEIVEVITVFKRNRAIPTSIKWNNQIYPIKKVSMVRQIFNGQDRVYCFAVSDDSNYFKLAFNTKTLQWNLEQVYSDG